MSLFLRHQLSPYCMTVIRNVQHQGRTFEVEKVVPCMKFVLPTPHGRYDDLDIPDTIWGLDKYGYNDFDDYHLALYGA